MKLRIATLLCMIGTMSYANNSSINLALPSGPSSYQSDKFRVGELDCSNAIGSATNLEFGVTGLITEPDDRNTVVGDYGSQSTGVYARITIPLGKRPRARINCNELYELELKRKRLEIMKLEQEIRQMQTLEFE